MKRIIVFLMASAMAVVGNVLFAANGGYENSIDCRDDATYGYGDYVTTSAKPTAAEARTQKFAQCKKLTSLDLSAVVDIGDAAFAYSSITDLTLSANVKSVGYISFGGCTNLESVTVKSWDWATGTSALDKKEPFHDCFKLTTLSVEGAAATTPAIDVAKVFPKVKSVRVPAANVAAWKSAYPSLTIVNAGGEGGGDEQETPVLYTSIVGAVPVAASVYDGYLVDAKGNVAGTIQLKLGKPNAKTGLASAKATVLLGSKKTLLKAADRGKAKIAADGTTDITLVGGENCHVTSGTFGLSGQYGAYVIDGARNFFTSKDKAEKGAAGAELNGWLGAVNLAWDGGVASVSIAKKGKAKVSATLVNGTKVTANTQFLIGEEWYCIPVVVAKKADLAFAIWLPREKGKMIVSGLGKDAVLGKAGSLKSGAAFRVDKSAAIWSQIPGNVLTDYLPNGVPVTVNGLRWSLPKAGKVVYLRGTTEVDEEKTGENPSALKLTCKAKDGSFKGSFKAYADNGGRLKATTVNVTGVVLDGVGHGIATIRNVGSVDVSVE
ncbi:MAG: leucine-rich repeat protein [Kiritimatiellae bacterium]|nr:leucine-rich repeat protein [Kiritimatiellia bacterium]